MTPNDNQTIYSVPTRPTLSFEQATGPVKIPMTNDYLFKAMLQVNNKVLKGLISSLLHIPVNQIASVQIRNPIELGKAYGDKEFLLDTLVELNNYTIINLEMQVLNEYNWPERSLSYLCRSFDTLPEGAPYTEVKPTIHIGFLDFTLFPEHPEFYATYKLMNTKNHHIYSDKLTLSVLDLTHIDLATEEDVQYRIDHWATLFKATTWEEIKMLAQNNEYIQSASDTIYQLSEEEKVYWQCRAREDYYHREADKQKRLAKLAHLEQKQEELEATNASLEATNASLEATNASLEATNASLEATNASLEATNASLEATNASLEATNASLEAKKASLEAKNASLEAELALLKAKLTSKQS